MEEKIIWKKINCPYTFFGAFFLPLKTFIINFFLHVYFFHFLYYILYLFLFSPSFFSLSFGRSPTRVSLILSTWKIKKEKKWKEGVQVKQHERKTKKSRKKCLTPALSLSPLLFLWLLSSIFLLSKWQQASETLTFTLTN